MKFKSALTSRKVKIAGVFVALAAVSACNSQPGFGLSPGETLTQGYVIDQQQIELGAGRLEP